TLLTRNVPGPALVMPIALPPLTPADIVSVSFDRAIVIVVFLFTTTGTPIVWLPVMTLIAPDPAGVSIVSALDPLIVYRLALLKLIVPTIRGPSSVIVRSMLI